MAEMSLSEKVVEEVAAAENVEPEDLDVPLFDVIDPDALDQLFGDFLTVPGGTEASRSCIWVTRLPLRRPVVSLSRTNLNLESINVSFSTSVLLSTWRKCSMSKFYIKNRLLVSSQKK